MSEMEPKPFVESGFEGLHLNKPNSITVADIGEPVETVQDKDHNLFGLYVLDPGTQVPFRVSQWLEYQTFEDEGIGTTTADDFSRFGKPRTTSRRFLTDKGGRLASILVSDTSDPVGEMTSELAGITWLRKLRPNDTKDAAMVRYMEHPETTATMATRIYSPHRGKRLSAPLISTAMRRYFEYDTECSGVAIRINKNDANAMAAFGREGKHRWQFKHVANIHGVAIMYYPKPEDIEILRHDEVTSSESDGIRGVSARLLAADKDLISLPEEQLAHRQYAIDMERKRRWENLPPEKAKFLRDLLDQ